MHRLHGPCSEGSVIVGLGLDIAEIDRIEAAITRHGTPFIERLFTPAEVVYCESHKNRYERYAARFAVKEAAMKALGTGWRHGVRWQDIEVTREPSGKPGLRLEGVARAFADTVCGTAADNRSLECRSNRVLLRPVLNRGGRPRTPRFKQRACCHRRCLFNGSEAQSFRAGRTSRPQKWSANG